MTADTRLTWLPDTKTFLSTDSTGHSVVLSTPDENTGMKPSELLLSALAACTAVDVVEILAKKRTPLSKLEVEVSAQQDADPPWTFRQFDLHFILQGDGITEKDAALAIKISEEKYCSVAATLKGTAAISTRFTILEKNRSDQ